VLWRTRSTPRSPARAGRDRCLRVRGLLRRVGQERTTVRRLRGIQDVGLFVDRKGLGHADCGSARVLRA